MKTPKRKPVVAWAVKCDESDDGVGVAPPRLFNTLGLAREQMAFENETSNHGTHRIVKLVEAK